MTPIERLINQEALVDLILEHNYIPQKSAQGWNEMLAALREVNPGAKYDPGCQGCMLDIARAAKMFINFERDRMNQLMSEALFMTFPKHEQPSGEIESIEIANVGHPESGLPVYEITGGDITGISITSDSPIPDFEIIKPKRKPGRPKK